MVIYPVEYPTSLQDIPTSPAQLFYQGERRLLTEPAIAVVGSRALTSYGEAACRRLVLDLVRAGLVIVSGLAMGIDTIAHRAALEAGGRTIAVLGNGLTQKNITPQSNLKLARQIMKSGGLLVTEYSPETEARPHHFPARNRIIAGLGLGTVVVEATAKSGALITAHFALDFNREVFAVPGSIFSSRSMGTHRLIQRGAKLVTSAQDIIQELGWPTVVTEAPVGTQLAFQKSKLTPAQGHLIECLEVGALSAEQLLQQTATPLLPLMLDLTELEIQGIVRKNRNQKYEISHS